MFENVDRESDAWVRLCANNGVLIFNLYQNLNNTKHAAAVSTYRLTYLIWLLISLGPYGGFLIYYLSTIGTSRSDWFIVGGGFGLFYGWLILERWRQALQKMFERDSAPLP